MNKVAHFFLCVDMRQGHEGLWAQVKAKKVKVKPGDYVIFLNARRNIVKMFCGGKEVLLSYKKDNRVIDPGVIPHLPMHCGGNEINMDAAIKEMLLEVLDRRGKRPT